MKILVTGHRGFIGQNMVKELQKYYELSFFEWGDPVPEIRGLDWVIHLGAISSTTESDVERVMRQNYDFSCWILDQCNHCLLYTSPSPRDLSTSRMPSSA